MRFIAVIGGKGGVGKTTIAANLSAFLAQLGYGVTAIDCNLTTPNLGLHVGLHLAPVTLHDVLKGEELSKALYPHQLGFNLIPGSLSIKDLTDTDPYRLLEIIPEIRSDFLIIDSAAGLGKEAVLALQASEEVLIVTNPEVTAVADALRTIKLAENLEKRITGVVLNRVKRKKHELTKTEVEDMLSYPVITKIPEDKYVSESIAKKIPVVIYKPNSNAGVALRNLGLAILGSSFRFKRSFFRRLFFW